MHVVKQWPSALVNFNFTVLAHAYVLYARALQSRIRGGTFAAPVRPALKSGTAMRTTVKSGTAFAVPAGPSTPPLYMYISGRTSCRKCSKCFYIQCDIPQCNYKRATRKRNRLNDLRLQVRGRLCRAGLRSPDACILLVV